jgi:hypothetical protein
VKSGVNEFNIPANELLTSVSELVNKKEGIRLPNMPIPKKAGISFMCSRLMCQKASGKTNKNAITIRNAPTWFALMPGIANFIKINEEPQTNESEIKISQLSGDMVLLCTVAKVLIFLQMLQTEIHHKLTLTSHFSDVKSKMVMYG